MGHWPIESSNLSLSAKAFNHPEPLTAHAPTSVLELIMLGGEPGQHLVVEAHLGSSAWASADQLGPLTEA
jgi:hypothetical protein